MASFIIKTSFHPIFRAVYIISRMEEKVNQRQKTARVRKEREKEMGSMEEMSLKEIAAMKSRMKSIYEDNYVLSLDTKCLAVIAMCALESTYLQKYQIQFFEQAFRDQLLAVQDRQGETIKAAFKTVLSKFCDEFDLHDDELDEALSKLME